MQIIMKNTKKFYDQYIGLCYQYDKDCYRKIFEIEYVNSNHILFHGVEIDTYEERIEAYFESLDSFEKVINSDNLIYSKLFEINLKKIKKGILKNVL